MAHADEQCRFRIAARFSLESGRRLPMIEKPGPSKSRATVFAALIAGGAAIATALVMALYANISNRKAEAREISFRVVDLDEKSIDPTVWAKNFPRQFDGFMRTGELTFTKYGGAG